MAEAFIGMTVTVTLKAGAPVRRVAGKVVNIYDQTLMLERVIFPDTGEQLPSYSCPSYLIADLDVVDSNIYQPTYPSGASTLPLRVVPPQVYTDPAILSYARPTTELFSSAATPIARLTNNPPSPLTELPAEPGDGNISEMPELTIDLISPRHPQESRRTKKGKGWRSTPLLEETDQPVQDTPLQTHRKLPKASRKKKSSKKGHERDASQNGWATEDATDVQDLGDFDFEANLSKFDKRAVFEQIRNDDTTADEDRLVSHNRARPGTYGGKNLHPTEMVLSPALRPTDPSDFDIISEAEPVDGGGRVSRQSLRPLDQSRRSLPHSNAGLDEQSRFAHALQNVPSSSRPLNASVISSTSFNVSTSSLRGSQAYLGVDRPHLRSKDLLYTYRALLPERLQQIEREYQRRGLTLDILDEVTARAIAQSVCKAAAGLPAAVRRTSKSSPVPGQRQSHEPKPVVVVIAGNHRRGAKALAAARNLFGRHYKILLSVADLSSPASWHPAYKTQIQLVQTFGRKRDTRMDSWPSISAHIKQLPSPPALIIEALLDGTQYSAIDDVPTAIEARDVIDWMNRSRASVFSLECPSGYDASTGETTVVEGEPLAVKPDRVLGLGAVVTGVVEALGLGERWNVTILDVGLGGVMAAEEVVRFGSAWSVDVEFASVD